MKEIKIDKTIGSSFWENGIVANEIAEELKNCENEKELRIVIDSYGGAVFEAVGIFGAIKDFARRHKECNVETWIRGVAMSAASFVALAAKAGNENNKIVCENTSVFMIHNAWCLCQGNAREMEKQAKILSDIDEKIIVSAYCEVSKKDRNEIRQKMDETSYFFGQEIVDWGFADKVLEGVSQSDNASKSENAKGEKVARIENAKRKFAEMMKEDKMATAFADFEKVVAMVDVTEYDNLTEKNNSVENYGNNVQENAQNYKEKKMTMDELKAQNSELFEKIKSQGVQEERARVNAHLDWAVKAACFDVAKGFIADGTAVNDEKAVAAYFEAGQAKARMDAQKGEQPNALQVPNADKNNASAFDEKAFKAAFENNCFACGEKSEGEEK